MRLCERIALVKAERLLLLFVVAVGFVVFALLALQLLALLPNAPWE